MSQSPEEGFLDLPTRPLKPRSVGLSHVLDRGTPLAAFAGTVEAVAAFADIWKFGWGTAYIDPSVAEKVEILRDHGVLACPGGTLVEIASQLGRTDRLLRWAADLGFTALEVSNGAIEMSTSEKRTLIAKAAREFVVLSEVGSKDPEAVLSPDAVEVEAQGDLEAGARWVVLEGRESGTVGLYDREGQVREDLVEHVAVSAGLEKIVFEAPLKDQQAWFIRRFGPGVNLGNVPPENVLGLETLRLGLRADTIALLGR